MSQSRKQSMTENRWPNLGDRVKALEKRIGLVESAPAATPGYQLVGDQAVFTGGIGIGGQVVYEPYTIPAATALTATWSASFDTIGINLSWTAPEGLGSDQIASYVVTVQKHGSLIPIESTVAAGTLTTRIEPVEPNTTYDCSVSAMSKLGRLSSPATATVTTGGDTTPPAAPTFPSSNAVLVAISGLSVKWNANTERDVANGAGQYRVVVSPNADLSSPVFDAKTGGTTLFVNPLTPGTPYYVGVYAIDSSGNQSSVGKPPGGPWTALANVTDTSALAVGGGNIILNSGFEDPVNGLVDWTLSPNGATLTTDNTTYHTGIGRTSAKITGALGDAIIYQTLTLSQGVWTISAWVKGDSIAGAGQGAVLNWQVTAGTYTSGKIVMGSASTDPLRPLGGNGTFDWKRIAFQITVTSATATMNVYLQRGYGGACTGTAWWDDVQAENGSTITAYAPRADEILQDTIQTTQINDNAITSPKIVAGAIVAGKIAANTVGAVEIISQSITANQIATNTITATQMAAGSITANQLAANSVTAAAIEANSITGTQLAANTITAQNLAVSLGLVVGQFIQSSNFVSGSTGWRIDGNGNSEFNAVTVRNGAFVGGQINVSGRIFADPSDPTIHLAANIQMGSDYNGSIWAGGGTDQRWGLQVGDAGGTAGGVWTHVSAGLQTYNSSVIGWYDQDAGTRVLFVGNDYDVWNPGPYGRQIAEKVGQAGDWGTMALLTRNGSANMNEGDLTSTGLAFHVRGSNVASILYCYGPQGSLIEAKTGDNSGFIPLRASSFLVASSSELKHDIRALADDDHDVVTKLRPVRFRRPGTHCAWCHGTGRVARDQMLHAHSDPKSKPVKLKAGDKCPHCKGKTGTPSRTHQQKAYEDSDFLGLIAEEVGKHVPEAVAWTEKDGELVPDSIDYSALVALLIDHSNKLADRITKLEAR